MVIEVGQVVVDFYIRDAITKERIPGAHGVMGISRFSYTYGCRGSMEEITLNGSSFSTGVTFANCHFNYTIHAPGYVSFQSGNVSYPYIGNVHTVVDIYLKKKCVLDSSCPAGSECVNGVCVEVTPPPTPVPECVDNLDCPTGYECVSGVCVKVTLPPPPTPVPEGCVDDADCPSGYKCENGSCVSIAPPPTDPMTPLYVGVGAVVTGGILYYLIKRSGEKK